MNFFQLHERLRLEIARRINRGSLTGRLLANQTGVQPSHISNFLRRRRMLSLSVLDRILDGQSLTITDLLPRPNESAFGVTKSLRDSSFDRIPLVSHAVASTAAVIGQSLTIETIRLPAGILDNGRPHSAKGRRDWRRFVAVRVSPEQTLSMSPPLIAHSIAVLDRHYNLLVPFRPPQPNIYAVNVGNALVFRYVSADVQRVVLRPHQLEHELQFFDIVDGASVSDHIVGRVCVCISPM
jgi:transcriptional regulator with XRE-family HTH domain